MMHFRVLGALDLRGPHGEPVLSVLAQPKRLALLAYLVLARPSAFHRRDIVIALFWPELDSEHARAALSQALHFLRRALPERVLVSRGTDELGVDGSTLWCDAVAFCRAAEAGYLEEACELYRGDLLDGLFVSGAPEWERWLDAERSRLRAQAVSASWALAERNELAGDVALAAHWARRAVALAPLEEPGVRRLMALLARVGDRTGAVRGYEAFARRLADELNMEPASEVRALAEKIRLRAPGHPVPEMAIVARTDGALRAAAVMPELESLSPPAAHAEEDPAVSASAPSFRTPAANSRQPPSAPIAEAAKRRPIPRGRPMYWHVVLMLVGLTGVASLGWGTRRVVSPGEQPESSVSTARVAVLPFSFHGNNQFGYLGEGMASLVATNLNGAGALQSVDPRALLSAAGESRGDGLSSERPAALAAKLGAGLYVVGDIVEIDGRLRIRASLYTVADEHERDLQQAAVEGHATRLFSLVDDLSTQLLAGWTDRSGSRLSRTAARSTESLAALKAYFEGEQAIRRGQHAVAAEAFRRSVEADTSFALAYYRLSRAMNWTHQDTLAKQAAAAAVRHGERLRETDRLLVQGWRDYLNGAATEAERLYRTVLAVQPDNVEAWYQLAEILFHWKPALGSLAAEARPAFEQVLRYEANNVDALLHLARIACQERRRAAFDSLANRISALAPDADRSFELAALRAFAFGDAAVQAQVVTAASGEDWASRQSLVQTVAVHADNLAGAERVAHAPVAREWRADERAYHGLFRAHLALARGRWSAARAELDQVERLQPWWAAEQRAALAIFPLLRLGRSERDSLRSGLLRVRTFRGPLILYASPTAHQLIYEPRQLYVLGMLNVRSGETKAALELARRLDTLRGTGRDSAFSGYYARTLRAEVARARGQAREALAALGEPELAPGSTLPELFSHAEAYQRWLRAELLHSVGRHQHALRWYASFRDPTGYDLIYLAPSHLRRAEIYERLGQRARAAEHYRRFLELWEDADPGFEPLVVSAQRNLAQLGS